MKQYLNLYNGLTDAQKAEYNSLYRSDPTYLPQFYIDRVNTASATPMELTMNLVMLNLEARINAKFDNMQALAMVDPVSKYGVGVKRGSNSEKWTYQRNQANKLFGTKFNSAEDVRQFQITHGLAGDGMLGQDTLNALNKEYGKNISLSLIRFVPKRPAPVIEQPVPEPTTVTSTPPQPSNPLRAAFWPYNRTSYGWSFPSYTTTKFTFQPK